MERPEIQARSGGEIGRFLSIAAVRWGTAASAAGVSRLTRREDLQRRGVRPARSPAAMHAAAAVRRSAAPVGDDAAGRLDHGLRPLNVVGVSPASITRSTWPSATSA